MTRPVPSGAPPFGSAPVSPASELLNMEQTSPGGGNLMDAFSGVVTNLSTVGEGIASLYDQGDKIWNSLPFNNEAEEILQKDTVKPVTVVQSPVKAEQSQNIQAQASWMAQNKAPIIIAASLLGVALIGAAIVKGRK